MNKQFYKDEIAACIRNVISDQESIDRIIEELERRPEIMIKYFSDVRIVLSCDLCDEYKIDSCGFPVCKVLHKNINTSEKRYTGCPKLGQTITYIWES